VGNISFYLKITISNTRDIVRFAHSSLRGQCRESAPHSSTHTKQHRTNKSPYFGAITIKIGRNTEGYQPNYRIK
jgi:hypothetical protein